MTCLSSFSTPSSPFTRVRSGSSFCLSPLFFCNKRRKTEVSVYCLLPLLLTSSFTLKGNVRRHSGPRPHTGRDPSTSVPLLSGGRDVFSSRIISSLPRSFPYHPLPNYLRYFPVFSLYPGNPSRLRLILKQGSFRLQSVSSVLHYGDCGWSLGTRPFTTETEILGS